MILLNISINQSLYFMVTSLVKGRHHPHELRGSTLEHWMTHASAVPVYTDGSKSDEGVGSSAVFPSFEAFWSLPQTASVFMEELLAIFLALTGVSFDTADSFIIYSNSGSTLHALGTSTLVTP